MFSIDVKIEDTTKNVTDAVDKAAYRSFGHAAGSIRKHARASILPAPKAKKQKARKGKKRFRATGSPPGTPPFTRRSKRLPNAIVFAADRYGAIIGPRYGRAGLSGMIHEFGGEYKGNKYPERAFMWPALTANVARFAGSWENAVTG